MKAQRGCGLLPWLLAALSLLLFRPGLLLAADDGSEHVSVSLNAGETYVIENVGPRSTPGVRVIENPHALVVHNEEPGKVVLLGAESGKWSVEVQQADGKKTTYDVAVHAIANPKEISHPAEAPPAISGSGATTGSAAPVVAKLDAGAGPVDASSRSGDSHVAPASSVASAHSPSSDSESTSGSTASTKPSDEPTEVAAGSPAPSAPWAPPSTEPAPASSEPPAPATAAAPAAPIAAAAPAVPAAADAQISNPVIPSQTASAAAGTTKYRTDPSIAESGGNYYSDAVSGGTHYLPDDAVVLMTGTSRIIDFPSKIRRVSIADTAIADIQVVNPFQLNLIGHKPGFTTLAVWNQQGHYDERMVRIDAGGKQQVLLNCIVAELDRNRIENQGINLSLALTNYNVSMFGLPGGPATPFSPQSTITTVLPNGTVISGGKASLPLGGSLIPLLLSQNVTYGLAAQNGNVQTQTFFQFLENHNLGKVLAQPHLLANSGETAKFLSGGEIPIVIAQALNTSIVFKEFGTSVQFMPTVVGRNDIELYVKPQVSEPDYAHGVQMFGFNIPAFVTRRAETLVRLRDNQTLIIAGLILHNKKATVNKVPYLGDIPYVNSLFRTTTYENDETDLVMSVTPQIVRPLPDGAQIDNPVSGPEMTTEEIRTKALAQPDASRPRF